jgi:hypothetical protein
MSHPTLKPGTRVRCTYRSDPGFVHEGTLLADDDPRGWEGSLAFYGRKPTLETVRAHIAEYRARWPELARHDANRAIVAWDFGKVYTERADAIYEAPAMAVRVAS